MSLIAFVVLLVLATVLHFVLSTTSHVRGLRGRMRLVSRRFGNEFGELGGGTLTLQELVDERGQAFARMEDIVNTHRADDGTVTIPEAERAEYDQCAARFDELTTQIAAATEAENDAQRAVGLDQRRRLAVPMVNRITDGPASANRSLDELLWASADSVTAGTFGRTGMFIPNPYGARNAVEPIVVRNADDETVEAPRIEDFRPEHRAAVRNFQRTVADMAVFGLLVDRSTKNSREAFEAARENRFMRGRWEAACRALDVDTAAEGGNWVPTGIGADMHEKVRAAGKVAPLFARIDLPTNPWKWPLEGADATAYRVAEPTGDTESKPTASTPGTGAATFDAEIFGGRTLFSRSIEADSALAILPFVRNKLVRAFVDAEEKAIIDGDTDGTHQDSDVGASTTDARTAWDGLRKRGLANTAVTGGSATATLALFRSARAAMGKWGLNPADLACILSIGVYYDLLATSDVTTVDKMGPQAVILNGQLGAIDGVPLVVSEHFREDLNASGVYDGITTTETGLIIVNRMEWALGQRMALDVEVDDSIYRETFQRVVIAFMREDFQNIGDASTNDDTAFLYNLD